MPKNEPARYTLFVDESGEAGIEKVRSESEKGASPYMVLGAVLLPWDCRDAANERLDYVSKNLGKEFLHCSQLSHSQKVFYSRTVSGLEISLFGVISFKDTLGSYKDDIQSDSKKYYNKCAQYLFERLGQFMKDRDLKPEQVDICMEEGNFDYQMLRNFISACQQTPVGRRENLLNWIDTQKIRAQPKKDELLLQLADLTAHSLYQCVHRSNTNFGIPEPRYFCELKHLFPHNPSDGKVVGYGVKPVHDLRSLKLDDDVRQMFENLNRR